MGPNVRELRCGCALVCMCEGEVIYAVVSKLGVY